MKDVSGKIVGLNIVEITKERKNRYKIIFEKSNDSNERYNLLINNKIKEDLVKFFKIDDYRNLVDKKALAYCEDSEIKDISPLFLLRDFKCFSPQ